jgi:aminoglycoside phosphotransferase (APT) family kinase protein
VNDLERWGVLANDPVVRDGLVCSIDRWAARKGMTQFVPTLTHGDATTTNFIFPWDGGVVAVDWERLCVADPAADLGRLMAEVSHSIKQHGGSVAEAVPHIQRLVDAYSDASTNGEDAKALLGRARYYQAVSTLRIARNGWASRLDRTALVAQSLALLNSQRVVCQPRKQSIVIQS